MSKPLAVILAVVGWVGVGIVSKFHDLVPNASEDEIRPFVAPVWILALVLTALAIKSFAAKPAAK
jgi:hypothetical protein